MLEATDICVTIGRARLLQHATLTVEPGRFVALVGENGAGKSTLLNVLTGDVKPANGLVRMNGRPLYLWNLRERARLRAVLAQDAVVAFGFTAMEVALFGRYPHCDGAPTAGDVAIARAALAEMGVESLAGRDVTTLSGGERTRVHLARVLAQLRGNGTRGESRYLLLDEPTAALDLAHQQLALSVARRLAHEENTGVLAIVHDLNLAAQFADTVVMLKAGRVAVAGSPREVLTGRHIRACFGVHARVLDHPELECPLVVTGGREPRVAASPAPP